jgi:superfamily II DNA or RNA helicase
VERRTWKVERSAYDVPRSTSHIFQGFEVNYFADNIPVLKFHLGTLVLGNYAAEPDPLCLQWDARSRQWRAKALFYDDIIQWLSSKNIPFVDQAAKISAISLAPQFDIKLHDYQKQAVATWQNAQCRGSICLPTGTGKSWVALSAMQHCKTSTLVILPTLDLMNQWYELICQAFNIDVGILGGGYHDVQDITVTTYDSAYIHMDKYGNRFGLLIFDEVHHLPSQTYSFIPEMCIAPKRLGLTATYARPDGLHGKLEQLIGPLVYKKEINDFAGDYLADYRTIKIPVELTPSEKADYQTHQQTYLDYVREKKIKFKSADLSILLKQSAHDPRARQAFLARQRARRIQLGATKKLDVLESLLKIHINDQVLIFYRQQ